jgi:hypothetical protein
MKQDIVIKLIDQSEGNIALANKILIDRYGLDYEVNNDVITGFFTSKEQLQEMAHWYNDTHDGVKQLPSYQRPLSIDFLASYHNLKIGEGKTTTHDVICLQILKSAMQDLDFYSLINIQKSINIHLI